MPGIPKLNLGTVASGGGWAVGEKYAHVPPQVAQQQESRPAYKVAAPRDDRRHSSDEDVADEDDEAPPPAAAGPTPPPKASRSPGVAAASPQPPLSPARAQSVTDVPDASDDDSEATFIMDSKPLRASGSTGTKPPTNGADEPATGAAAAASAQLPVNRPVDELPTLPDDDDAEGDNNISAGRKCQPGELMSTRELEHPVRAVAIVNGMVWCAAGEGPLTCYAVQANELCVRQVVAGVCNIRSICLVPAPPAPTGDGGHATGGSPGGTGGAKGTGGDSLWCGMDDGKIIIVSLFFEREDGTIPAAHNNAVFSIVAVPGGRVWSLGRDRVLRLWDASTRQTVFRKGLPHEHLPRFLRHVENTNQLWSVSGRVIRCWDCRDGTESRVTVKVAAGAAAQGLFSVSNVASAPPALGSSSSQPPATSSSDADAGVKAKHELVSLQYHAASGSVWVSMFEHLVILTVNTATAGKQTTTTLTVAQHYDATIPNVAFVGEDLAVVVGRGQLLDYTGSFDVVALLQVGKTAATKLRFINRGSMLDGVSAVGCHYLGRESPFAVAAHTTLRQTRCLSLVATRPVERTGSWRIQGHEDATIDQPPLQNYPSAAAANPQQQTRAYARDSSHPATSGHTTPPGSSPGVPRSGQRLSKQNSSNAPPTGERTTISKTASGGGSGAHNTSGPSSSAQPPRTLKSRPSDDGPSRTGGSQQLQQPIPHTPLSDVDGGSDASFVVHDEPMDIRNPPPRVSTSTSSPQRGDVGASPSRQQPVASPAPSVTAAERVPAIAVPPPATRHHSPPSSSAPPPAPRPTSASPSRIPDSSASSQVAVSASTHMATPTVSAAPASYNNHGGGGGGQHGAASHRTSRLPDGQNSGVVAAMSATGSTPEGATTRINIDAQRVERKVDEVMRQLRRMRTSQDRVSDLSHALSDSLRGASRLGLAVIPSGEEPSAAVAGLPELTPELEEIIDARYSTPDGRTIAVVLATMEHEIHELRQILEERDDECAQNAAQIKQLQQQVVALQTAAERSGPTARPRGHGVSLSGGSRSVGTPAYPAPALSEAGMAGSFSSGAAAFIPRPVMDANALSTAAAGVESAEAFLRALESQRRADQAAFNDRLRAVERQHQATMAKLQAMTQGWTRILSQLEIATAQSPPPVVLACAEQNAQPASAVVADLFAPDSHALVGPSSSVEQINRASKTVSDLIRSHVLREPVGGGSGAGGFRRDATSADRLTDYLDRLEDTTTSSTLNAARRGPPKRGAASTTDIGTADSTMMLLSGSGSASSSELPWVVVARLAMAHLHQADSFAQSLRQRVSFLSTVPSTLVDGSSNAAEGVIAPIRSSRPLEASGLLLMRAETFAEMCAHEATMVLAEVTGDDWRRLARNVPAELAVSRDFWDLFGHALHTLEESGTYMRKALSATKAASLPFGVDATDVAATPSDPLLELRRVLAATSLPVGGRGLTGFLRWCSVWCLAFAFHLAHVLRAIEGGDLLGSEEDIANQVNAVTLRFEPLSHLERRVRFFVDLFDPSHGAMRYDDARATAAQAGGNDDDAQDTAMHGLMRRATENPFASWIHASSSTAGDEGASAYLSMLGVDDDSDTEGQLEAVMSALAQLRDRARELVAIAFADETRAMSVSARSGAATEPGSPNPPVLAANSNTTAHGKRLATLRNDLAALQVRTKRLNASMNPASPVTGDLSPMAHPRPAGPGPDGADPASPAFEPLPTAAAPSSAPHTPLPADREFGNSVTNTDDGAGEESALVTGVSSPANVPL